MRVSVRLRLKAKLRGHLFGRISSPRPPFSLLCSGELKKASSVLAVFMKADPTGDKACRKYFEELRKRVTSEKTAFKGLFSPSRALYTEEELRTDRANMRSHMEGESSEVH